MFVYIIKREIVYLLHAFLQLQASCLAYLSILIHFQNYSKMALFCYAFLISVQKLTQVLKSDNTDSLKEYKETVEK